MGFTWNSRKFALEFCGIHVGFNGILLEFTGIQRNSFGIQWDSWSIESNQLFPPCNFQDNFQGGNNTWDSSLSAHWDSLEFSWNSLGFNWDLQRIFWDSFKIFQRLGFNGIHGRSKAFNYLPWMLNLKSHFCDVVYGQSYTPGCWTLTRGVNSGLSRVNGFL